MMRKGSEWVGALLAVVFVCPYVLGVSSYSVVCPEPCCDCEHAGDCCDSGATVVGDSCDLELDQSKAVESRQSPTIDGAAPLTSSGAVAIPSSGCGQRRFAPPVAIDDVFYLNCSLLI